MAGRDTNHYTNEEVLLGLAYEKYLHTYYFIAATSSHEELTCPIYLQRIKRKLTQILNNEEFRMTYLIKGRKVFFCNQWASCSWSTQIYTSYPLVAMLCWGYSLQIARMFSQMILKVLSNFWFLYFHIENTSRLSHILWEVK